MSDQPRSRELRMKPVTRHAVAVGVLVVVALFVTFLAWKAVTWQPATSGRPPSGAALGGAVGVTVYPLGSGPSMGVINVRV